MSERVDLLSYCVDEEQAHSIPPIELVRLDGNEVAIVPFTSDITPVKVHYCDQSEINGYVRCNVERCVLCMAGRKVDERLLLPVYLPSSQTVAALPLSRSSYPGALLPQIRPFLQSPERVALLVTRYDKMRYRVKKVQLQPDMDDGATVIKTFLALWEADDVDLASVYTQMDNQDLIGIKGIADMLKLKGIHLDDKAQHLVGAATKE